jgi:hypothetical protein
MEEKNSIHYLKKKSINKSFYCVSNLWFPLVQIQSPQFEISDEKDFPVGSKCLSIKQGKSYFKMKKRKDYALILARTD